MDKILNIPAKIIKAEAKRLGFSACGIARAEAVSQEFQDHYLESIEHGYHADMDYLTRNMEKRFNPALLVEGTRSVVTVALNYYPEKRLSDEQYQFAWYAYGLDYHDVVKARLQQLLSILAEQYPQLAGRAFCDTAPIPERYWAERSGLGWIGRHTQLIIPHMGSTFFLGEILINADVDAYDSPLPNRCGTCHKCIDACPMQALSDEGINARRCLSYLTIENRGEIPPEASKKLEGCIYGCDRCLKACPHTTHFATPTDVEEFSPKPQFINMSKDDWHNLSVEQYRTLFKGSAVKRAKYEGLMRNIKSQKKS